MVLSVLLEDFRKVLLARGLYDADGVCHREAWIRLPTGREELALVSGNATENELLGACLERIGEYTEITLEHTSQLVRGDRHRLLLSLRASLFGDKVGVVISCPNPACRVEADMDVSVSNLLSAHEGPIAEVIEVQTSDGLARLREPTGLDDVWVAQVPNTRRARSALLWSRLLLDLGGRGTLDPEVFAALSPDTRGALALALAEKGSALDLAFVGPCPGCRALLELEIDPMALLLRELGLGAERIIAEVHVLAFRYHWSEADILSLTRARRYRYIDLISRELEGRPLFDWGTRS